ncbi:MAG: hypothetical protein FJ387_30575 [Verrucomicrobia bacterium]|nr:hypothetical protein [Verrucomicrobiota bacterium]
MKGSALGSSSEVQRWRFRVSLHPEAMLAGGRGVLMAPRSSRFEWRAMAQRFMRDRLWAYRRGRTTV